MKGMKEKKSNVLCNWKTGGLTNDMTIDKRPLRYYEYSLFYESKKNTEIEENVKAEKE